MLLDGKQIRESTINQAKLDLVDPLAGNDAATKNYVDNTKSIERINTTNKGMNPTASISIANNYVKVAIDPISSLKDTNSSTEVYYNSTKVKLGPNEPFEFRDALGLTARNIGYEEQGDYLYVNTFLTGYDISTDDTFDFNYLVSGTISDYNPSGNIIVPSFTSPSTAPTASSGNNIVYTATSDAIEAKFMVEDDDNTSVTIDYNTGMMSGGSSASIGIYSITLRTGNVFGVSNKFYLSWHVV